MKLLRRKEKVLDAVPGLSLEISDNENVRGFKPEIIEGLRHLITRVQQRDGFPERLSLTAALRQEGVSYIAQALAVTMAHDLNQRICLVDLNFWWPDAISLTGLSQPSLAQVLDGDIALEEALLHTNYPNLDILPCGEIPRPRRPVLAKSEELAKFIDKLSLQYEHLILDTPAVLATTESVSLASLGDAALLVIHQGATQVGEVSQALDEIEHLKMLGSVLNQIRISMPKSFLKAISTW